MFLYFLMIQLLFFHLRLLDFLIFPNKTNKFALTYYFIPIPVSFIKIFNKSFLIYQKIYIFPKNVYLIEL